MINLQINNHSYDFPQSWDDLTNEQIITFWKILNDVAYDSITANEVLHIIKLRLFFQITGLNSQFIDMWKIDSAKEFPDDHLFEIREVLSLFDWLFEGQEDGKALSATLFRNPFQHINGVTADGQKIKLIGPSDSMDNLTLGELIQVFTCVERIAAGDELAKTELVATLYRPIKPDAHENDLDQRQPYIRNEHLVAKRIKLIEHLDDVIKDIVSFWAACIHRSYTDKYENLFEKAKEIAEEEKVGNDYSWGGLILSLSGDITKIVEVQSQQADDAFVYMSFLEDARQREIAEARKQNLKS
ncbi:MAG: hypothetical protein LCH44_11125 [Bacteroidetes bacterium]|nr:hypothetical protein [Bacteroidota bacterium]